MSAIFVLNVTSRESSLDRYMIADMASAYNLALDVVADPTSVLDWTLPNANYLFPDLLMLLLPAASGWHFDEAIPLYAAASLLVFTVGSLALSRLILDWFRAAAASAVAVSLAGALVVIGSYPGSLIAAPNFHASIAIFSPVILAATACAVLTGLSGWKGRPSAILAALLLGGLSFSDRLTAVCITAPLVASLVIAAAAQRRCRGIALKLASLLGLVSAAAIFIDMMWRPDNPGAAVAPSLAEFWSNLAEMYRLAADVRWSLPWTFYLTLATPLLALAALAAELKTMRKPESRDIAWMMLLGYLAVYYPLISFIHAASTLEPVLHYRLSDLTLACVFIPILAVRLFQRTGFSRLGFAVMLAASAANMAHAAVEVSKRNFGTARVLPFVKCLDELARTYNLSYGAAEYWDAIPVRPLSREGLNIVSVGTDFLPRDWNQTRRFDKERPFDLIVHRKFFDPETLKRLPPVQATSICEGGTVYILKPQ